MIKVILFDLGGVLFTNGTSLLAKHIAQKHNKDHQAVYDLLNYSDIGNAYREGKITRDEFWDSVKEQLGIGDDTNQLEATWISFYEIIEGTKYIINSLRKKYKVYFLSDSTKERIVAFDRKFEFSKMFHGGIFAHEHGVRKPNSKIYEIAIEKIGVKPEEILFIDDKQLNLPPAEKLNMQTLLFSTPEKLQDDLTKLKLL